MPYTNDSQIIAANVFAKNGVIHMIDMCFYPKRAECYDQCYGSLLQAVVAGSR